jgi:two-component system response regulator AtoC
MRAVHLDLVVIEPDRPQSGSLITALGGGDTNLRPVASVEAALALLDREPPDAVLLDIDALAGAGLADVVRRFDDVAVIVVGGGGARQAVEAIRSGARDFLERPVDPAELAHALDKLVASPGQAEGEHAVPDPSVDFGLLGTSKPMKQVYELIRKVAATDATALIRGESGTGKELVARALHRNGGRSGGPFIKVHCAGLPETLLESELFGYERGAFTGATCRKPGRVEIAEGGTLFFDEIGDIAPTVQVKLLRLLQDRQYERLGGAAMLAANVRFIAATHRDLEHMVKKGEFREDLFYRLNVVPIWLPPLRARRADVAELAVHFCASFARTHSKNVALSQAAIAALGAERWPGNVRQLQNFVERLVVLASSPVIEPADIERELAPSGAFATDGSVAAQGTALTPSLSVLSRTGPIVPLDATLRAAERAAIERALLHVKGNRALAARLLGVGRATLYKKIAELGIED